MFVLFDCFKCVKNLLIFIFDYNPLVKDFFPNLSKDFRNLLIGVFLTLFAIVLIAFVILTLILVITKSLSWGGFFASLIVFLIFLGLGFLVLYLILSGFVTSTERNVKNIYEPYFTTEFEGSLLEQGGPCFEPCGLADDS